MPSWQTQNHKLALALPRPSSRHAYWRQLQLALLEWRPGKAAANDCRCVRQLVQCAHVLMAVSASSGVSNSTMPQPLERPARTPADSRPIKYRRNPVAARTGLPG